MVGQCRVRQSLRFGLERFGRMLALVTAAVTAFAPPALVTAAVTALAPPATVASAQHCRR